MSHRELPYTIEDLTHELLALAEEMFGRSSSPWSFCGVRINDLPPHIGYLPDSGEMYISLSRSAEQSNINVVFQLAHEICHTLYPSTPLGTTTLVASTVLNEGVSTYFSLVAARRYFGVDTEAALLRNLENFFSNYAAALGYTSKLLSVEAEIVKRLRSIRPMLNDLTETDVRLAGIEIDTGLLRILLGPFKSLSASPISSSGAA